MSLTDSYRSRDLEPGVILAKFLIFGRRLVILIKKKRCTVSSRCFFDSRDFIDLGRFLSSNYNTYLL